MCAGSHDGTIQILKEFVVASVLEPEVRAIAVKITNLAVPVRLRVFGGVCLCRVEEGLCYVGLTGVKSVASNLVRVDSVSTAVHSGVRL